MTLLPIALIAMTLGAEPMMDRTELESVAKAAKTSVDHAKVAKQYRLRAEEWNTKAERHEAEVKRLQARPRNAMDHKWPAMANNSPLNKERQLAVEARRASVELTERADYHYRASIEAAAE